MNIAPHVKRCFITAPGNPLDVLGEGAVQWSTIDGMYAVKVDDTGVISEFPGDMVVFLEDIERTIPFPGRNSHHWRYSA